MKRIGALVAALLLFAVGLWFSYGFESIQVWFYTAGLVGLVGICAETFFEQPGSDEIKGSFRVFTLWIAPGMLVVAALWLARLIPQDSRILFEVGSVLLMAILLFSFQASLDPHGQGFKIGRFSTTLILYLATFLLYALIYHTKERGLFTATSIGVVTLVSSLEALRPIGGAQDSRWLLSGLAGVILAETAWALNYWPISGLVGGAFLLLAFYVYVGLLLAVQEGGVTRRLVTEYGTVGIAGLMVLTWAMG